VSARHNCNNITSELPILGLPKPYASDPSSMRAKELKYHFTPSPLTKRSSCAGRSRTLESSTFMEGFLVEKHALLRSLNVALADLFSVARLNLPDLM